MSTSTVPSLLHIERYQQAPFQKEDLEYLIDRDWSANWSEMGCYKTTTALWLADKKLSEIKNPSILVITTKAGKGTYFDAIPKSLDGWKIYNVTNKSINRRYLGIFEEAVTDAKVIINAIASERSIFLAHYHSFVNKAKYRELLTGIPWDMIIVDEAHRLKNKDAQWTRNIKTIKSSTGYRHIMTGTGFINRPDEIWSLLNFLHKPTFGSYWRFRNTFCEEIEVAGFRKVVGIKPEMVETFRELRKMVGVRRELREVRPDIDEPIFTAIDVELNTVQRKMYNEIKKELHTLDQKGVPITSPNVLSQLNRLRQICVATPEKVADFYDPKQERRVQQIRLVEPSSKLDALEDLIDELQWDDEAKQQLVVFSCFRDPIELLKVRLDRKEVPYLHLQHSMNDEERYRIWHDIWPKKEHRVFLSTLQLGSESINLSSAQHAVFLDRSWSPKDNAQGVGRIYRPGQEGTTQIIHINAIGTTDQRIERTNITKMSWFKQIFSDDE